MIDVTTLTDLITQFRNTTASNSVSPETVGSILQKIVDILATAGTQANLDIINKWHEALKTAAPALTALSQGTADRNHIYLAARSVNLYTGAQTTLSPIQIQQATTERAGAMRAQQVVDLNAARRDVADIKKQITTINSLLGVGTADNLYKASQISCQVVNGSLHLLGAQTLTAAGYVPYLFRRVRKRNPYKNKFATDEQRAAKKYCPKKKGWAVRLDVRRKAQRHRDTVFHQRPRQPMHRRRRLVCRPLDTRNATYRPPRQRPLRPRS